MLFREAYGSKAVLGRLLGAFRTALEVFENMVNIVVFLLGPPHEGARLRGAVLVQIWHGLVSV